MLLQHITDFVIKRYTSVLNDALLGTKCEYFNNKNDSNYNKCVAHSENKKRPKQLIL